MSLNKFTLKAFDGKSPQNFGGNDYNTYNDKGGLKLPSPKRDFGYDQRSEASGADSYYPAIKNAGTGLYKRMAAETPQSEMNSYLNWVPQREKINLASIQKHQMSPLKASLNNYLDEGRDGLSRTVMKARDKFNYSQLDSFKNKVGKDQISIDGISVNGFHTKPRAISNLRTYDNGNQYSAQKIELSSIFKPKNNLHMTPGPKRGLLDELPWSDQQKIMGYSMAKINTLKRDDILRAINLPDTSANNTKQNLFRRGASIGGGDDSSPIDDALKRIAKAGEDFGTMKDYARALIKRFDSDNDGVITFQELCEGLKQFDIDLPLNQRIGLMKKLDVDRDGEITDVELTKALKTVEGDMIRDAVETAIKKIASGAEEHSSMREYVKVLFKKFDLNNDGLITLQELSDGLKRIQIFLSQREKQALMSKLDINRDGEISSDELFKILQSTDTKLSKSQLSTSVDHVVQRLLEGSNKFASMKEYARHLIKKFDNNSDGIINFQELCEGLSRMNILITNQEKAGLMKKLDIDRDGQITEKEMLFVLTGSQGNNRSPRVGNNSGLLDKVLMKIANGADDVNNMRQYSKQLIKKFDRDNDGYISLSELTQGLRTMGIYLTNEERDALMSKLDTNRDGNISDVEIYNVLSLINTKDLGNQAKENADIALKKLAAGAEEHSNMKEYVRFLIKKFDFDNDGIITFNELCDGIRALHIFLTLKERQALMKALDLNNDGELSADELYNVLSKVDVKFSNSQLKDQVENALKKIASGAEDYSSMKEYVKDMMNKFDSNYDGFISFEELTNGLRSIKINLSSQEKQALMKRLDFNRDGEIAEDEIFRAIAPYGASQSYSTANRSPIRSSSLLTSPNKVSLAQKEKERISVDDIISKIKKSTTKYQSLKHFVSAMMRRYDTDGDGYLNFQELSDGLAHDNIKLTKDERLALMKHLDVDCDGAVSRDEIFNALVVDARHQRSHHFSKVNVDHLLKRIKQGAEKFRSLQDFCHYIFKKMDIDGSGTLSFNELSGGLTEMGIEISQKEKHELMKKLDDDADGEIAFDEFYKGLSNVSKFSQPDQLNQSDYINVDHALIKIARGAEQYKCIEDYIILLFRKFDINKDGALSFKELRDGLMSLNVHLADNEMHALFHKLDTDRDGDITQEELYNAILSKEKYTKNPNIGQQKVNVDHVLALIRKGVEKYSSLGEYVKALMKKFDQDGDGSISIDELSQGLKSINVKISDKERLALMKELDKDRDGGIAEHELYNALAQGSEVGDFSSGPKRTALGRPSPTVEQLMAKIRRAVSHYKSQQEQIIGLMRIFDLDNDGMISFIELVDGVKQLGIQAKKNDMIDLMNRMDVDKDGWISQKELYNGLGLQAAHNEYQGTTVQVDQVLTKLKKGAEKYHNLGEYINVLFQMFATAGANFMTFQELNNCLKTFNFNLTQVEKLALMKKMDENGDNEISKEEFFNALASAGRDTIITRTIGGAVSPTRSNQYADPDEQRVDQALLKIKSGAAKYRSLGDYCMHLMRKLDTNKDGAITYLELVEGLRDMGIKIYKGEQAALMRRLDDDKDGVICYDELYRALNMVR